MIEMSALNKHKTCYKKLHSTNYYLYYNNLFHSLIFTESILFKNQRKRKYKRISFKHDETRIDEHIVFLGGINRFRLARVTHKKGWDTLRSIRF